MKARKYALHFNLSPPTHASLKPSLSLSLCLSYDLEQFVATVTALQDF